MPPRPLSKGCSCHTDAHSESILIIDFGSQVTQLIARRIRETGVYCEIWPYQKAGEGSEAEAQGRDLSGGPDSVTREGSPRAPQEVFDAGIPIMAICYGQQTMACSSWAVSLKVVMPPISAVRM